MMPHGSDSLPHGSGYGLGLIRRYKQRGTLTTMKPPTVPYDPDSLEHNEPVLGISDWQNNLDPDGSWATAMEEDHE